MTLQEIQYKAQGIIHKWRDDDSAPYIKFVEELAHMIVPEPSEDLEEAANKFAVFYDQGTCDGIAQDCFIAGAKWQAEQLLKSSPLPEDTVLFNKGVAEGKRLMMEEAVEGEVMDFRFAREVNYSSAKIKFSAIPELKVGDKVRIIVIPNIDEK